MADPRIGAALSLIHQNPGRGWTVGELGAAAGMSRSAFAVRFKDLVGLSPADYLLRWRMQRARNALRRGEASVHRIALEAGYRSASAFGNAFKRVFGRPPRRYAERSQIEWSEP
jgi:transcriptional regulator GlxA family with amidase domain